MPKLAPGTLPSNLFGSFFFLLPLLTSSSFFTPMLILSAEDLKGILGKSPEIISCAFPSTAYSEFLAVFASLNFQLCLFHSGKAPGFGFPLSGLQPGNSFQARSWYNSRDYSSSFLSSVIFVFVMPGFQCLKTIDSYILFNYLLV